MGETNRLNNYYYLRVFPYLQCLPSKEKVFSYCLEETKGYLALFKSLFFLFYFLIFYPYIFIERYIEVNCKSIVWMDEFSLFLFLSPLLKDLSFSLSLSLRPFLFSMYVQSILL